MKIIKIGFLITLVTCLTACNTQTFLVNGDFALPGGAATYEGRSHFFVYGIGQTTNHQVAQYCGGKENIHSIETKTSAIDVLLNFIAGPLYTPQTYKVYCMPGSR